MHQKVEQKMSVAPDSSIPAGTAIKAAYQAFRQIRMMTQNAKSNKENYRRLTSHAKQAFLAIVFIQRITSNNKHLDKALEDVAEHLLACLGFLEKYDGTAKFKKLIFSSRFKQKFDQLHQDLNDYKNRLLFGMITKIYAETIAKQDQIIKLMLLNADKQSGQQYIAPMSDKAVVPFGYIQQSMYPF